MLEQSLKSKVTFSCALREERKRKAGNFGTLAWIFGEIRNQKQGSAVHFDQWYLLGHAPRGKFSSVPDYISINTPTASSVTMMADTEESLELHIELPSPGDFSKSSDSMTMKISLEDTMNVRFTTSITDAEVYLLKKLMRMKRAVLNSSGRTVVR